MVDAMLRMEKAFREPLAQINQEMKQTHEKEPSGAPKGLTTASHLEETASSA